MNTQKRSSRVFQSGRCHEQGGIVVLLALSLSTLIGMMALAIDLTRLFIAQTHLQALADSCSLAAMAALPCATSQANATTCTTMDYVGASDMGQLVAQTNQSPGNEASVNVSFPQKNQSQCQVQLIGFLPELLQLFGVGSTNLMAQSVATVWPQQTTCTQCGTTHFASRAGETGKGIPVLIQ